jgi:hypothetical protein
MFGYVTTKGARGEVDRLLAEVADRLRAEGWSLAGAVQQNSGETCAGGPCDMDLRLLDDSGTIRISQSLGALSEGCRLDPAGLEEAVGRVAATLRQTKAPRLMIVNKFGRQEAEGRGFRPVIAEALGAGIPVLTAVGHDHAADFSAFAEGMAQEIDAEIEAVLAWCRAPG